MRPGVGVAKRFERHRLREPFGEGLQRFVGAVVERVLMRSAIVSLVLGFPGESRVRPRFIRAHERSFPIQRVANPMTLGRGRLKGALNVDRRKCRATTTGQCSDEQAHHTRPEGQGSPVDWRDSRVGGRGATTASRAVRPLLAARSATARRVVTSHGGVRKVQLQAERGAVRLRPRGSTRGGVRLSAVFLCESWAPRLRGGP